jgi:hypothetical protein
LLLSCIRDGKIWIHDPGETSPGSANTDVKHSYLFFCSARLWRAFDAHIPGPGVWTGPGMEKFVSRIPDKLPGSATLTTFFCLARLWRAFDAHIPGEGVWTGPGPRRLAHAHASEDHEGQCHCQCPPLFQLFDF